MLRALRAGCASPAARFAFVGLTNFVVSFTVFYLSFHHLPDALKRVIPAAAAANVLAYAAGMVNSFALNRSFTFRAAGNVKVQAVRFFLVNLASLAFSTLVLFIFVDLLRYPEVAVWVPTTMVAMTMNYLGCRHWAFAPQARTAGKSQ